MRVSADGNKWNDGILPPLPFPRNMVSAINTGEPEYVIAAGGRQENYPQCDTVDILVEEQWWTTSPFTEARLPSNDYFVKLAVHNGSVYCINSSLNHFFTLDSIRHAVTSGKNQSLIKTGNLTTYVTWFSPQQPITFQTLISFGRHLVGIHRDMIFAYSTQTHSWDQVENLPKHWQCLDSAVVLPTGELLVLGENCRLATVQLRGIWLIILLWRLKMQYFGCSLLRGVLYSEC